MSSGTKKTVRVRLIFGPVPAEIHKGEPTFFGLQDAAKEVHPGKERGRGSVFECELIVSKLESGTPAFSGAFANGPTSSRFLYLSWKRLAPSEAPWVQRIKVPLSSIARQDLFEALDSNSVLEADVTGRRPHDTTPIVWKVVP